MTRRSISLLVIVSIPLALVFSLSLRADPPEASQADDPFAGKILVLNERSNPSFGATLEEVHLKRIGDQTFLVGKGFASDEGKGWYNGRVVWVPRSKSRKPEMVAVDGRLAVAHATDENAPQLSTELAKIDRCAAKTATRQEGVIGDVADALPAQPLVKACGIAVCNRVQNEERFPAVATGCLGRFHQVGPHPETTGAAMDQQLSQIRSMGLVVRLF